MLLRLARVLAFVGLATGVANDPIDVKPPDQVGDCGCTWVTARRCKKGRNDGSKCWKICCHAAKHGIDGLQLEDGKRGGRRKRMGKGKGDGDEEAEGGTQSVATGGSQPEGEAELMRDEAWQSMVTPAQLQRHDRLEMLRVMTNSTRARRGKRSRKQMAQERAEWLEEAVLGAPTTRWLVIASFVMALALLIVGTSSCVVLCCLLRQARAR